MQVSCHETIVTVEVEAVFARWMRLPCETRDCPNLHDVALWSCQFELEIPRLEIRWVSPLLERGRFNLRSVYVKLEVMVRKEHRVCGPEVRFHALHFILGELDSEPREVDVRRSFGDWVDLVIRKEPVLVIEPGVVEFD